MKEAACELALQADSEVEMRERDFPLSNGTSYDSVSILFCLLRISVPGKLFQCFFLSVFLDISERFWNGYAKSPAQGRI